MNNMEEIRFRGKVLSGRGEAKGFMKIDWVREQCRSAAGFEPYPGTLNLQVNEHTFSVVRRLAMSLGQRIIPPVEAADFCEARLLPLEVHGQRAAVIYPMVNEYYSDIIEVIAPVLFKDTPGVRDGTFLEASLKPPRRIVRPAAVIFDLDGTLLDSVDLYYSILCEGCLRQGVKPPQKEMFLDFMGKGLGFWDGWAAILGAAPPEEYGEDLKREIMAVFEDIWQQRYEQEVSLFPGVGEMLLNLHKHGIRLGVVTSSFYIRKMETFKKAGLDPDKLFTAVITRNDTLQKKPHPEPIHLCLEQLAVAAPQCICVGDSPCDILAGNAAGLFTVGVLSGAGTVQSLAKEGAAAVLDSVAGLEEMME